MDERWGTLSDRDGYEVLIRPVDEGGAEAWDEQSRCDGVPTLFWACPRPKMKHWGSGQVLGSDVQCVWNT